MPFAPPTNYASKANTGYESQLSIGSPLAALVEIKSFKLNLIEIPDVNTTHLLSPNNTEEMVPAMIKPGTIDITGNFIGDASQTQITTLAQAQTIFNFQATAPMQRGAKTCTVTGTGFFKKYATGPFENNKAIDFEAQIQITGTYVESIT